MITSGEGKTDVKSVESKIFEGVHPDLIEVGV